MNDDISPLSLQLKKMPCKPTRAPMCRLPIEKLPCPKHRCVCLSCNMEKWTQEFDALCGVNAELMVKMVKESWGIKSNEE